MKTRLIPTIALVALTLTTSVDASNSIVKVELYPGEITLKTNADRQRLVVVVTRDDGVTMDVTEQASLKITNPSVVRLQGTTLFPTADGETRLEAYFEGHVSQAKVVVSEATTPRDVSFHLDVMPVMMRTGCNSGSCHGAARGKDGFRLSLFGFDPKGDYQRITREIGFRRINLAMPEESLFLQKSIASVPHTGGKRFDKESEYYRAIVKWLEAGAPQDAGAPPVVTKLEIFPPSAVIEGKGTVQRFVARATYSDGHSRDVTSLTSFMSNNDNSAPIDQNGIVTANARGEAFVMARFETHTVGSQVLVLPENLEYAAPEIMGNYIDQLVGQKLKKIRLLPSEICTDEEFLRRVTIDITGLLPTPAEYDEFLADQSPDKRRQLVNRLLERKEFSEIWAMKWAELLMIRSSNQFSYKSAYLYNSWLTEQIANEVPLDQMVREILGATGGTFTNPPSNYYQVERDTLKTAENVAQVFMGIRTQCAQCHNHPFDRWTMDDYYSFAAFFGQIGRKTGEDYREQIIYNRGRGEVKHLVDGRNMSPKFLGGDLAETKGKDRRVVMADWLTAPENPYFSKNVANRIWAHFFGTGIVEPVDDVRVSNPPSNPELLDELGRRLVEYKYDFKQLVRDICNSQAYQRSTVRNDSNRTDNRNFASAKVRRIPAEFLLDSLSQVTNTEDKFRGLPKGARAVQIADGGTSTYFLTTFGRAKRESVCACESTTDPSLSQALHLLNGQTTTSKITSGGLVKSWLQDKKSPAEIIDLIYIRALTRKPTEAEQQKLQAVVAEAENPQAGLEDIFWAVLNSREFLFNH